MGVEKGYIWGISRFLLNINALVCKDKPFAGGMDIPRIEVRDLILVRVT